MADEEELRITTSIRAAFTQNPHWLDEVKERVMADDSIRDEVVANVAALIEKRAREISTEVDSSAAEAIRHANPLAEAVVDAYRPRWDLMRERLFKAFQERHEMTAFAGQQSEARREADHQRNTIAREMADIRDDLATARQATEDLHEQYKLVDSDREELGIKLDDVTAERDKYMKGFSEVCEQLSEYTKAAKRAWKAENDLRSDFGALAKDLRAIATKLHPGEATPHTIYLVQQEITAWAATAEVAANADIYEALTSETDSGDFGPVPRPEDRVIAWTCPAHPQYGPMTAQANDTIFCPASDCSHNSEEST